PELPWPRRAAPRPAGATWCGKASTSWAGHRGWRRCRPWPSSSPSWPLTCSATGCGTWPIPAPAASRAQQLHSTWKGGNDVSQRVEFLYLSAEDVRAAGGADMVATMAACEQAFRLFEESQGRELPTV